jgi:hypothetical protein
MRPCGQLIRLTRSLTSESKPVAATVPNQVCEPSGPRIRPRSTVSVRPAAMTSTAATGSAVGRPYSRAWSLPVPAGTMPSGMPVRANTCSASRMTPSPPMTTKASVPSSTASCASSRALAASRPTMATTSMSSSWNRATACSAACGALP